MSAPAIDVSALVPEAREIVEQTARAYLRHTAPWFVGLLAHGSSVKGGFIAGCSDIDLHLYLTRDAFSWHGQIPSSIAVPIQNDLRNIDPSPFRYIQCYSLSDTLRPGWVGPIPATYHMVAGKRPVPEATAPQLYDAARRALDSLDPNPQHVVSAMLGQGGGRVGRNIRLLCTEVWPVVFQVLTVGADEPIGVWSLNKVDAIEQLPEGEIKSWARQFHEGVLAYYPDEANLEAAKSVVDSGFGFLDAAQRWWKTAGRLE